MANAVTSLRLCATLDWQEYVESVSLVERVLQRDPGRRVRAHGFSQPRCAAARRRRAWRRRAAKARCESRSRRSKRARQAAAARSTADRTAHVGYHLVDRGTSRSRSRPRAIGRALGNARSDVAGAPRRPPVPRRHRRARPACCVAAGRRLRRIRGRRRRAAFLASRCSSSCRRATSRLRASSASLVQLVPPKRLPRLDFSAGVPETARTMVIVPTMLTSRGRRRRAARARRSAGPRQPRPVHPLRDPERLRRHQHGRRAVGRGDPRARAGGHRGAEPEVRRRPRRSLLPVSPRSAMEPGRARLDGLGAEAGKDRGVQPAAAGRHGHQLLDAGRRTGRAAVGPLLPHARLRHAPAARCRETPDRHHRAPVESCARSTAGSDASPRATAFCSRA